MTYAQELNNALKDAFESDERVYLVGQDILDPYGGAFKVSAGLSTRFPGRVITTRISEAGITGLGTGMAIRGLKPVVEIMFGDFITLCADQIVTNIAKFRAMYNGQVRVPIVIRTPMGGGRGYGPTHSQCLEKMFLGIPGLRVVAPSLFHDAGALLRRCILEEEDPVLFIEHKTLYPKSVIRQSDHQLIVTERQGPDGYPVVQFDNFTEGRADVVMITYGGSSQLAEQVLRRYCDEEIRVSCYLPSLISATDVDVYGDAVKTAGRVIVLEEGTKSFGWGAEVAARIHERFSGALVRPVKRIAAADAIIPASRELERDVLPDVRDLQESIEEILL